MMVEAVKAAKRAMFPIFRRVTSGQQIGLGVSGTGFFINDNGYFVTAAHCFDDASQQTDFIFYGLLPENLVDPPVVITEVARDEQHDIFLGQVHLAGTDFLKFSDLKPEVGRTVCISGYPFSNITINQQGGFELGGVRPYYQPSFILDAFLAPIPNNQGFVRTHDGYLIRDFGLYGMSGGPVVDVHGSILGMQASVTDPRDSTNGTRTISVQNAVAIRKERIIALLSTSGVEYSNAGA